MHNPQPGNMYTDTTYTPLTAIMHPWMNRLIRDRALLCRLLETNGSPIHLHHAGPFAENVTLFEKVFEQHHITGAIYYARKANPCTLFVNTSQQLGIGIDTASYLELKQCLEMGCDSHKLVVTAAIKNEQLVRLALKHDVLMMLDNEDECKFVNEMAGRLGKVAEVGIRISGFQHNGEKIYSRFGFDTDRVASFIISKLGKGTTYEKLRYKGFHFHLHGYSTHQRSEALIRSIELADELLVKSIPTAFIDMGGGILINYLSSAVQWKMFWSELKKAIRGERTAITFNNDGLGYQMIHAQLHGNPDVYPFYNELPKELFLDEVLSYSDIKGTKVASMLKERGIELRIQPGRSLLDQSGCTFANVIHRKKDSRGDWLVGLQMNRSQLSSASADFLLDPIFICKSDQNAKKRPFTGFLTGGYCLETDILLKRKLLMPNGISAGDVVCFPNTAGYMMHFNESRSHLFEFARNLVIGEAEGKMIVQPDLIESDTTAWRRT